MKKIFILAIPLVIIASLLYFQRTPKQNKDSIKKEVETVSKPEKSEIRPTPVKIDISKLRTVLKKEMSESAFFEEIIDFSKSEEEFFKSQPPTTIYANSKELIKQITDCLSTFCSMSADRDGYFDPKNTVADKLLARNLKLLYLVSTESNIFEYNLDDLDFERIFQSQNNTVQENALKLYLNRYSEQSDIIKLFNISSSIQEDVKGSFYALLDDATKQDPYLREAYLGSINDELKNANGYTKIEIIEKIEFLSIDKEEAKKAFDSICSEKSEKIINAFNVNLKKNKSGNITFDSICN